MTQVFNFRGSYPGGEDHRVRRRAGAAGERERQQGDGEDPKDDVTEPHGLSSRLSTQHPTPGGLQGSSPGKRSLYSYWLDRTILNYMA